MSTSRSSGVTTTFPSSQPKYGCQPPHSSRLLAVQLSARSRSASMGAEMTSGQNPVPHRPVKYSTAPDPPLVDYHRHGCAVVVAIIQQKSAAAVAGAGPRSTGVRRAPDDHRPILFARAQDIEITPVDKERGPPLAVQSCHFLPRRALILGSEHRCLTVGGAGAEEIMRSQIITAGKHGNAGRADVDSRRVWASVNDNARRSSPVDLTGRRDRSG